MQDLPSWLIIAIQELGQQEIGGPESNPRIDEYLKGVNKPGNDEIAWCSAFADYCLKKADKEGTGNALARSFTEYGSKLSNPVLGCIVVLKRGKYEWQGHVGFYLCQVGDEIQLLGGNQKNQVCVMNFKKEDVLAYRWPEDSNLARV